MLTSFGCDAVLFDLDGVLVDSQECVERHWRRWAAQHDVDWTAIVEVAPGRRTAETIALVAPQLNAEAEALQLSLDEAADTDGVRAVDGASELLALPEGCWAIVTSGNTATATSRLRVAGLPIPAVLVTADDVVRGKPDPEPYRIAAERLGVMATNCIVLEDSPTGVAAGRSAAMRVVGIASTHRPEDLAEADAVVGRLADVGVTEVKSDHRFLVTVLSVSRESGA